MRASESERVLACSGSLTQPKFILPEREKTKRATDFGTLVHWWFETGEEEPEWADPRDVKALAKKLALTELNRDDYRPPLEGTSEVTFAIQPFTMELRMHEGPREAADDWKKSFNYLESLTGSIDFLFHDGRVSDLKTGAWPVSADDNKQLLSYSLVPWLRAGAPLAWSRDVEIVQWPKYPLGALPVRTVSTVIGLQLMDHLEDIRWALRNPTKVRVAPTSEVPEGKLHPCAGCESREFIPMWSGWATNFFNRTLPHCAPGLASIAKNLLPED